MTVVVARGLSVIDLEVLLHLGLIDLEEEIGLGLDLLVYVGSEAFLLFAFELLLESECIELLLDECGDAALHLLQVIVVALVDLADLREDALLLLGAAELRQPLRLGCLLLLLFTEVGLRIYLKLLVLLIEEVSVGFFGFGSLGGGGRVDKGLHCVQ